MTPRPATPLSPPVYHVLLALGGDVLHGYGIMQRFEELLGGAEQLLPGSLYATLARMVESGLIEETRARSRESGGPPRRHYRATQAGKAAAERETERMRRLVAVARRAWEPGLAR